MGDYKKIPPGALPDDPDPRLGVGPFSLPLSDEFSQAGANHDAEYILHDRKENAYTRDEADDRFQRAMELIAKQGIEYPKHGTGFAQAWNMGKAKALTFLARAFGRFFW